MKNPLESTYCPHNHFTRFLYEVANYLYDNGWYTQSYYFAEKCHSFKDVENYLWLHCYTREEAIKIVKELRHKTRKPYDRRSTQEDLRRWLGMDWWKGTQRMSLDQIKLDARNYLEQKDGSLQCMDFKGAVKVIHQDGSVFLLENAIMEERDFYKFKLLLVWTEHCSYFFFFTEDLESWYYTPYEVPNPIQRPEGSGSAQERTDDY